MKNRGVNCSRDRTGITLTFLKMESRAAEYLKDFKSLSYSRNFFFRLASMRNSSTSPMGFDFPFCLMWPWPIFGSIPKNESNVPAFNAAKGISNSLVAASDGFACLLRTESVPSDIPAAIWESSGWKEYQRAGQELSARGDLRRPRGTIWERDIALCVRLYMFQHRTP